MEYKVVFIGVNYRTSNETIAWVKNISWLNRTDDIMVIVVDNSPEYDNQLENKLKAIRENLVFIKADCNMGYFPGANLGVTYLASHNINYSYLVVSNVDVEIKTKNFVDLLDNNSYQNAGVLAPAILNQHGDKNPYHMHRDSYIKIVVKSLYFKYSLLRRLLNLIINKNINTKLENNKYQSGEKIYMPYGATIIFSKNYFLKGADLNYPIFLYGEETYIAETCRQRSIDIVYFPEIEINDFEHASTKKVDDKKKASYSYTAIKYIIDNFYK